MNTSTLITVVESGFHDCSRDFLELFVLECSEKFYKICYRAIVLKPVRVSNIDVSLQIFVSFQRDFLAEHEQITAYVDPLSTP